MITKSFSHVMALSGHESCSATTLTSGMSKTRWVLFGFEGNAAKLDSKAASWKALIFSNTEKSKSGSQDLPLVTFDQVRDIVFNNDVS